MRRSARLCALSTGEHGMPNSELAYGASVVGEFLQNDERFTEMAKDANWSEVQRILDGSSGGQSWCWNPDKWAEGMAAIFGGTFDK